MHTAWRFLNTRNAHIEADVVCDFGDAPAELRAAESGQPVVAPLVDRASIRVTGEDATSFLHRLLTQDIETLTMASARRAGFCTAKGRLLASFLVWRENAEPPSYRLELPAELLSPIRAKLSMYVLRSAVKLRDGCEDRALIGLAGV
ncbi:MAG TPA: folate-binding protein, partial [Rhodocyclaceae bacterium]|nr:folate-binding protein [Rhodocyclaceae bacterium]